MLRDYANIDRWFSTREPIAVLKDQNGQLITDKPSICNELIEFFQSVFEPPIPSLEIGNAERSFKVRSQRCPGFSIEDIVTTEKVTKKLSNLCSDKTAGVDQVHPHVLKMCANTLSEPLALILAKSIIESTLPSEWIEANISPIFKKGSRTFVTNYRPVSLTSIPCKVIESFIKDFIVKHLEQHGLVSSKQYGFVSRKACVTNLLETMDFLTDFWMAESSGLLLKILNLSGAMWQAESLRA